jgi:hypothetical protein
MVRGGRSAPESPISGDERARPSRSTAYACSQGARCHFEGPAVQNQWQLVAARHLGIAFDAEGRPALRWPTRIAVGNVDLQSARQ